MELVGMMFICGFFVSMGAIGVAILFAGLAIFGSLRLAAEKGFINHSTVSCTLLILSIIMAASIFI